MRMDKPTADKIRQPGDRAGSATPEQTGAIRSVDIGMDLAISINLMFDPGHSLDERILGEQFGF